VLRILIAFLAALRAVLIYGEAATAESWQPARPAPAPASREPGGALAIAR
jgi:hypothetical protein